MASKFGQVIDDYLSSEAFAALSEATRGNWRRALILAAKSLGPHDVEVIRPAVIQAHLDGLSDFPGKQSVAKTAIKALEKWALVRDRLQYPITTGTQIIGSDGGHDPWTDEQIETAIKHARPDLARVILIAVNTGQRGSDIVKMRWSDIEEHDGRQGINVTQKKTGKQLWIPFTHDFASEIQKWERTIPFFLVLSREGRNFTRGRLSHDWTLERDTNPALVSHKEAKLVLHGLRSTTVIRFRRLGFTELEIASYIGMSEPMVARYSRHANQQKMALASVERLENFKGKSVEARRSSWKSE